MEWYKNLLVSNGITELLFTSDGPKQLENGTLAGVFATVNSQKDMKRALNVLQSILRLLQPEKPVFSKLEFRPGKPLMVAEFWSGWFDHWTEKHHLWPLDRLRQEVTTMNTMKVGRENQMFLKLVSHFLGFYQLLHVPWWNKFRILQWSQCIPWKE